MAAETPPADPLSRFWIFVFGSYLVVLAIALCVGLYVLISSFKAGQATEPQLVLLVIVAGALGSYVHAATSFASYVGNRKMGRSWLWWYVLRPFIGASLALIFYFVVRGGFLASGSGPEDLSYYGIAALAGLTGMFSKQAADKLRELFDNLFRVGVHDERKDKLTNEGK